MSPVFWSPPEDVRPSSRLGAFLEVLVLALLVVILACLIVAGDPATLFPPLGGFS